MVESYIVNSQALKEDLPGIDILNKIMGEVPIGGAYLLGLISGEFSSSSGGSFDPNIFLHDQNLVDILKDSTTSGAGKASLLQSMRRTSSVKTPKITPSK